MNSNLFCKNFSVEFKSLSVIKEESEANIQALEISENGTYTADGEVDGFSPITVNIDAEETEIALQEKTVEPTTQPITVEADPAFDGLSIVTVSPIQTEELTATENGDFLPPDNKFFSKVTVNIPVEETGGEEQPENTLQEKVVAPSENEIIVEADNGFQGLSKVTVNPIQTEELTLSENGEYFPSANKYFSKVTAIIPSESETPISLQEKVITPKDNDIVVEADVGYDGLSRVTVNAVSTEEITITGNGVYTPVGDNFFSKVVVNVESENVAEMPTLFKPSLSISTNNVLTIEDGNGDFATYEIRVNDAVLETTNKTISLIEVYPNAVNNEEYNLFVQAKAEGFNSSEVASAVWTYTHITQGLTYGKNSNGTSYSVTGIGTADTPHIVIPDTYEGLPVTNIKSSAFYNNTFIESVILGANITTVETTAFRNCPSLKKVVLNEGLTTIKSSSFRETAIEDIVIPASVKTLETSCFAYIPTLEEVIFKGTPTTLHYQTFLTNTQVFNIKVPWAEGEIAQAPWGATNAIITYNYTE